MNKSQFDANYDTTYFLGAKKNTKSCSTFEFHVSKKMRDRCQFDGSLFSTTGNVILSNQKNVRLFAKKINDTIDPILHPEQIIRAGQLNAMGLIDEIFHYVCYLYRKQMNYKAFSDALALLDEKFGQEKIDQLLLDFTSEFPPLDVYRNVIFAETYLEAVNPATGISNRITTLEEMVLLHLANENPAFKQFNMLFGDETLAENPLYAETWAVIKEYFKTQPVFGPKDNDLITMLKEPVIFSPNSLKGQLDYIRTYWADLLGEWLTRLLAGIDMISEEDKPGWHGGMTNLPPMEAYNYDYLTQEYERYSPDREWMPRVVLLAKTVLVWLNQLSDKYQRDISRLDQIPNEELDTIASQGFTGLWLIGLWERSHASKRIKQINGNPEAAASAYSLWDYDIAQNLGGWDALSDLRLRCWQRGIRLASDMVPNHTGMDARWVVDRPDLFVQRRDCPFPQYSFNGENLSLDGRVGIYLEDHYYQKTDCAVVFKRVDHQTGDTRYIYHGNDGTGMPWNDTAQIDFLNPEAREEVIQKILHVARNFPIIRFDAAMVLAKKHIKRLWYPEPGSGGDIATRSESALSRDEFENRIPNEFWREVVDRCAKEIPDTLLLAEAFWMMEGYFVRTLGMHRVYNSAFMNMLKKEENYKYRQTVKNTLEFDPQVLRRFVNFMNNPDEETAVAQFGKGDKYFGVCTLMVTMPGLPMFGHGQIEGFTEKYGMEYQKAYWKETPDADLIERHNREIFPLMKKRYLFAEVDNFYFYDVWNNGCVNENIYAYSNSFGNEKAIVFYNNVYDRAYGWIKESCKYAVKTGEDTMEQKTISIGKALGLSYSDNAFCIFHEQRSDLWYIRTSKEILDNGLFVSLNGFESQVYMEFNEVFDDETGKYRILYETLGGKGVQDIEVALQEIFLKDLYKTLTNFATPEMYKAFKASFKITNLKSETETTDDVKVHVNTAAKKASDKTSKDFDSKNNPLFSLIDKSAAVAYFEKLREFIDGNYGASQLFDLSEMGATIEAEKTFKLFMSLVENALDINDAADENKIYNDIYEGILQREHMPEYILSMIILYCTKSVLGKKATSIDAASLANKWGLCRKLFDIKKEESLCGNETKKDTAIILTSVANADLANKDCKKSCYSVLKVLFESPNAKEIVGLNEFNSIKWFGKELFEETLWQTNCAQVLFADAKDLELVLKVQKELVKAFDKAEYQVEEYLKIFAPAEKKAKETTKKPATKLKESEAKEKTAKKTATKTKKADKEEKPAKKPATKNKKI